MTFAQGMALLWAGRRTIFLSVAAAILVGVVVSLLLPPRYEARTMFMAAEKPEMQGGLGMLGGRLSDLADLAGLSGSAGAGSEKALAVLTSRDFTYRFLREERVVQALFPKEWDQAKQQWKPHRAGWFDALLGRADGAGSAAKAADDQAGPSLWDAFRQFDHMRVVTRDRRTGVITLSISWRDPTLAARWANRLVERANEEMRTRATQEAESSTAYLAEQLQKTNAIELRDVLFRLSEVEQRKAMLAHVRRDFAFEIIDPAVVPKQRVFPRRTLFVLAAAFVGVLIGFGLVMTRALLARSAPGA
jgi:uncharacterized protein involved in exopolysaccharide biosynthesis